MNDHAGESEPEAKTRTRVRIGPDVLAVLDAETEKIRRERLPVSLQRSQVLRILLARAVQCKCGAPIGDGGAPELSGAVRQIEADGFIAAIISAERRKLAREGLCVRLSRQDTLRVLVLKAARCTCAAR